MFLNLITFFAASKAIKTDESEKAIILKPKPRATYSKCSSYDKSIKITRDFWNEIIVERVWYRHVFKDVHLVFTEFFKNADFFPVAVRTSEHDFRFYIRLTEKDMDILFSTGLQLFMPGDHWAPFTINIDVADYVEGQVSPQKRFEKTINKERLKSLKRDSKMLHLNSFSARISDTKVAVRFESDFSFQLFCDTILQNVELVNDFQISRLWSINLNHNNIGNLAPFAILSILRIKSLDLSKNKIKSLDELNHLRDFTSLERLTFSRNPVENLLGYEPRIRRLLPNLKFLVSVFN